MHPLYIVVLLLLTASCAALLAARQQKNASPLLVPAGLVGLGISFLVSLSGLFFSGEKGNEHLDLSVAALKSKWQYPFSRLAEKTGGGKIVLIEPAPMSAGLVLGASTPVAPGGSSMSHDEELQSYLPVGCSLSILKLKAGQEYVTSDDLESALKNGAKGLIISAPLPAGADALAEMLGDAEEPLIHIPIVLMTPASPGSYKAYLDNGSILGIVSSKVADIDWTKCQLNRKSPLQDLFDLTFTWYDRGHQPGQNAPQGAESAAHSPPASKKKSQNQEAEE